MVMCPEENRSRNRHLTASTYIQFVGQGEQTAVEMRQPVTWAEHTFNKVCNWFRA